MKKKTNTTDACIFFVFDEAGNLSDGGAVGLTPLNNSVEFDIKIFKKEAVEIIYNGCPVDKYTIVDGLTGGRLKLITGDMDEDIPYQSITFLIKSLRERFELPLINGGAKVPGMFVKPNPAKP